MAANVGVKRLAKPVGLNDGLGGWLVMQLLPLKDFLHCGDDYEAVAGA